MGGGGGRYTYNRNVLGEQVPKYNAIRIQTSTQGMVIPVVFGTTRITGNFIWTDDYRGIRQETSTTTTTPGGGKGGWGGGGSANVSVQVSYVYQVAFAMGLCEGPIQKIIRQWASKSAFSALSGMSLFKGTYPQLPWSYLLAQHPDAALNYPGLAYVASAAYPTGETDSLPDFSFEVAGLLASSVPITVPYDLISNGNFARGNPPDDWPVGNYPTIYNKSWVPNPDGSPGNVWAAYIYDTAGWGGAVQAIVNSENGVSYKLSFWYKVHIGSMSVRMRNDAYQYEFPDEVFPFTDGAWHYFEKTYTETLAGTAGLHIAFFNTNNNYPGLTETLFEIYGVKIEGLHSAFDANPADIIEAIVSDPRYGMGLSSALLDLSDFAIFCLASGFLLSPAFTSQQPASDQIQNLLDEAFSTAIWHDGSVLRAIPYADAPVIGNGVTWTPDVTARYDLGDDDFLVEGEEEPVKITRKSPAMCNNNLKIECLDRQNDYNVAVPEAWEQALIDNYLLRPGDTKTMHDICDPAQGQILVQLMLQRQAYIRNTYTFKLGWKYCLLEGMDVVSLTDSGLGMDKTPVRITQIEEDENFKLTVTAEEFLLGIGNVSSYGRQAVAGYVPNYNIGAPSIDPPPLIFLAPQALWADQSKPEIWIAATGGPIWGGCDIYVSSDDATYQYAGTILGRPRAGVLTSPLPSGSDPDTLHTCSVDISRSFGELLSGSQLDADNIVTACAILDGGLEVISYQTATLTAAYKYDLIYLRRGAKGTEMSQHPAGSKFIRLDNLVAQLPFDSAWLHSVVYFKFCSFNIWKSGVQSLADVVAYPFVVQSPLSDLMSGVDAVAVSRVILASDSGAGIDSVSVSTSRSETDTGHGTDTISVSK